MAVETPRGGNRHTARIEILVTWLQAALATSMRGQTQQPRSRKDTQFLIGFGFSGGVLKSQPRRAGCHRTKIFTVAATG